MGFDGAESGFKYLESEILDWRVGYQLLQSVTEARLLPIESFTQENFGILARAMS